MPILKQNLIKKTHFLIKLSYKNSSALSFLLSQIQAASAWLILIGARNKKNIYKQSLFLQVNSSHEHHLQKPRCVFVAVFGLASFTKPCCWFMRSQEGGGVTAASVREVQYSGRLQLNWKLNHIFPFIKYHTKVSRTCFWKWNLLMSCPVIEGWHILVEFVRHVCFG